MAMELFQHNQAAYDAALSMLSATGKAAIVHPTGTGKSFIGFKLAEDHPDCCICWLSPSEYIFQTQLENLRSASADSSPKNIRFFTYAKLMLAEDAELAEIQPDFIIFDEFHRCGAAAWGKAVERLLSMYPRAPILGLSATSVRYLDNQRNMADELFDGNVASEITLGEAIVRGILLPPTYVVSVFSYQQDLERYQRRVAHTKSPAARSAAERYLDALRRALEKADGLDVVFQKHIKNKTGKYIAFCANREHMEEMKARAPFFFQNVDPAPHIYSVYSEDPMASGEFAGFKADASNHLKLLFCIDMLNEGVHVDDVAGVILFRPTISPIIYKQQIGRALSVSNGVEPVIFDVVNNFENLYSIGSIQDEMESIVTFYRNSGRNEEIVNDTFQVFDEVRECRRLFDELESTLAASWDMMFAHAKAYFQQYGDLDVPKRYKTPSGLSLGLWIQTQRRVRAGKAPGILTDRQAEQLSSIHMIWENRSDVNWEKNYAAAKAYFDLYGHLNIKADYVTPDGIALGKWICNLRQMRHGNIRHSCLSAERIQQLDALHMIWDKISCQWEKAYLAAAEYAASHGNLDVPAGYVCADGFKLGAWISRQRAAKAGLNNAKPLTDIQVSRLEDIGMRWANKFDRQWEASFREAERYFAEHGDLDVPLRYAPDGIALRKWLVHQRESFQAGKLSKERQKRLESIGFSFDALDSWEVRFLLAKQFYTANGHLNIPQSYVAENGIWLGKWLYLQRSAYREQKGSLTPNQIQRLEAIGMDWLSPAERAWEVHCAAAEKQLASGAIRTPWLLRQEKALAQGKLSPTQAERIRRLLTWEYKTAHMSPQHRVASKQKISPVERERIYSEA